MRLARVLAVLVLAAGLSAIAAVPQKLSYQGYLTSGGVPVNGTVSMNVKLYDALTSGNLIWSETQSVTVVNGVYNIVLGNTTPLDNLVTGPLFLTVAVGADPDMAPRTPLASAPYALLAKSLDGTLGVAGGGTGVTSASGGGLLYGTGANALGVTGAGSVGQILTATAGGVPQWSNNSSPNLLISHAGPGLFTIQSAGVGVSVQAVQFTSGNVSLGAANSIAVGGAQVVGGRQAAVADAVDAIGIDVTSLTPGQVVTIAEYNALVAQFNALLGRLRSHGLIEP